ncbi:glycerophosphodiester phosphodiesterase [Macrococcus equipercicus]|uniref:Glycerophosphodiester phosphodiesterase n=1 Tax=Macrococcus equipercicus TaxID=69967 RepID=A0A9Q9BSJ7_9STAP|nr:glycerophosphodiester phosphodiesterase [Macrococcus equipercicus]KAA1038437.1 glycerophosphodiester phosphodiesterase [Macrococcus equipercicus]UTH13176.1 glycerophosphodiester phosphodiesterase [Macrococcus equipercicus]
MLTNNVVIAHRGASGYAPEHTFSSYDMSQFDMKADYIELDVQMTLDGEIIIMHDETVERTSGLPGVIKEMTLKEIKQLDVGSWYNKQFPELQRDYFIGQTIPTLEDVIGRYGAVNYYIETKAPEVYPGMEERLVEVLDKHGLLSLERLQNNQTVIQSFSLESLIKVHHLVPAMPLLLLTKKGVLRQMTDDALLKIHEFVYAVGPSIKDLDAPLIKRMHQLGFLVFPYTLNEPEDMKQLIAAGIDGAFTNYADRLRTAFNMDNSEIFEGNQPEL